MIPEKLPDKVKDNYRDVMSSNKHDEISALSPILNRLLCTRFVMKSATGLYSTEPFPTYARLPQKLGEVGTVQTKNRVHCIQKYVHDVRRAKILLTPLHTVINKEQRKVLML